MFDMSFAPGSLKEIVQFYSFEILLQPEVQTAMVEISEKITEVAQANTWSVFDNPEGTLAKSIEPIVDSPFEVQVGVGVPYGRRREYGFLGLTDSLGRVGGDRARPYLQPAMKAQEQWALMRIEQAVEAAFARMRSV